MLSCQVHTHNSHILPLHTHTHTTLHALLLSPRRLTNADVLIIQFGGGVAEVSQPAVLAVLASGVVLAADAGDNVQVVDVAAAIGVAVTLTVYEETDTFSFSCQTQDFNCLQYFNYKESGMEVCCILSELLINSRKRQEIFQKLLAPHIRSKNE